MAPGGPGMSLKRIHREIADLKREDLGKIALGPVSDASPYVWKARIPGPEGSVYEGGVFEAEIQLPQDYPAEGYVHHTDSIYHMNVSERGNICIDILKHNWSPALSVFKVILSLSSLLTDPNPADPLVPSIAAEYLRNRVVHDETARNWTSLYAKPPAPTAVIEIDASPSRPNRTNASSRAGSNAPSAASSKGKIRAAPPAATPHAGSASGPIEIDSSEDDAEEVELVTTVGRGTKRRKSGDVHAVEGADEASSTRRAGKRRAVDPDSRGEVIVIED
ncbi:ubiquitin-conjugating enzyme/RWD-like protein [Amylostereum chailletii]|nr:ubiquitin-conjugating enzyme/RWD-like protein [Amylostereum chailletii]